MKVLLDTNVWRALADANSGRTLMKYARRFDLAVLVAPAIVDECKRIPHSSTRSRVLHLLAKESWRRCMPEPYSESQELIREIERLRPHWLRKRRDLREFRRLKKDWTSKKIGFWNRLKKDVQIASPVMLMTELRELELARAEAHGIRKQVSARPAQGEQTPLSHVYTATPFQTIGESSLVEYWRVPTLYHMRSNLSEYANPYSEWLDGTVDMKLMFHDADSLNTFFLCDALPSRLTRLWLRAAFEFLQSWRRVTNGTPGDAQISVHLAEANIAISADRNFVYSANRCHAEGPGNFARAILVPGQETVDALFETLSSL